MALDIGRQLADLKQMSVRELREKYEEVFGEPTRAGNKDFLFKRIAWWIQSLAEGDLSERAQRDGTRGQRLTGLEPIQHGPGLWANGHNESRIGRPGAVRPPGAHSRRTPAS